MSEPTKHAATRAPAAAAAPKGSAKKAASESDAAFWSGFSSGAADREKTRAAADAVRSKIAALAPEPDAGLGRERAPGEGGWDLEAGAIFDTAVAALDARGPGIWQTDPAQRERVVRSWARVADAYAPGGMEGLHPLLAAAWDTAFWAAPRAYRHWAAHQAEKNAADAATPETPHAARGDAL